MSATSGLRSRALSDTSYLYRICSNIGAMLGAIVRATRPGARPPAWPSNHRLLLGTAITLAAIVAAMLLIDASAVAAARRLPAWLVHAFNEFTDFGKSGWFLFPIGFLLIFIALASARPLAQIARLVLAAVAVRFGFIFLAIALPGMFINILKHVIGRARPFVAGEGNVFAYAPFSWPAAYASMPSGHATTAFSAVVAIGAIWPSTRPLMWTYAVLIGISRVVITAHHPSDVLAGAAIGMAGALLVRHWFASRRLGFVVADTGAVRCLPGPSWRRIKAVARRLLSA